MEKKLVDILLETHAAHSRSRARRLIILEKVFVDDVLVDKIDAVVTETQKVEVRWPRSQPR